MKLKNMILADPGGNITAVVMDDVAPEHYREIGAHIQKKNPSVEQVAFVQKRNDAIHGQMAGGEFCGNAARAIGYILAKGKKNKISFSMSGTSLPVTVVTDNEYSKLILCTKLRQEDKNFGNASIPIVYVEDIAHALIFFQNPLFRALKECTEKPDWRASTLNALTEIGITSYPACGLIFIENKTSEIHITPYIFVRDVETLYAETACASGAIAVAGYVSKMNSAPIVNFPIHQPSGKPLYISLRGAADYAQVEVSGPMKILSDVSA